MATPPSWLKLSKQCTLYNRFSQYLAGEGKVVPDLVQRGGMRGRWKTAIPRGTRIVYRKHLDNERFRAYYDGQGVVVDTHTGTRATLNGWCREVRRRDPDDEDFTEEVATDGTQVSAPQACNVVMEVPPNQYTVPVKLFDYVEMERLDSAGLATFVHSMPLHDVIVEIESDLDQYADYLTTSEEEPAKRRRSARDRAASATHPVAYGYRNKRDGLVRSLADKQLWAVYYGPDLQPAICIACGIRRIHFRDDHVACHINPRSKGGINTRTWNYYLGCMACNLNGKAANAFDQLADAGRLCMVVYMCDAALLLYCSSESHAHVEFAGRADFVRRVFGQAPHTPGGVRRTDVFSTLDAADKIRPLPQHLRGPQHYLRWLMNNPQRHIHAFIADDAEK